MQAPKIKKGKGRGKGGGRGRGRGRGQPKAEARRSHETYTLKTLNTLSLIPPAVE